MSNSSSQLPLTSQQGQNEQFSKNVFCLKLQRTLPALKEPPIPGELGETIYQNISAQAWRMFVDWFRTLCCEQYLDLSDPASDRIFFEAVNYYFFRQDS